MIEIKGKTIIYTLPSNNALGQVSPFLFIEKLEDEITLIWPQLGKVCPNPRKVLQKN